MKKFFLLATASLMITAVSFADNGKKCSKCTKEKSKSCCSKMAKGKSCSKNKTAKL